MVVVTLRCVTFKDLERNIKFFFISGLGGKYPEKPQCFVKIGDRQYQYPELVDAPVAFHLQNLDSLVAIAESNNVQIDKRGLGGEVSFW